MRLGSIIYLVPFIFVLDPSFILHGHWQDIAINIAKCLVGIWLIVGALQRYLTGFGHLTGWLARSLVGLGGLLIAAPDLSLVLAEPPGVIVLLGLGLIVSGVGLVAAKFLNRQRVA